MNTKAKEKKKLRPEELFNEWWSNEIDYGAHKFTEKERVAAYHGYMVGYNKASEGKSVINTESKCDKHFVTNSVCGSSDLGEWCIACEFKKECQLYKK